MLRRFRTFVPVRGVPSFAAAFLAVLWVILGAQACGARANYHLRDSDALQVATYHPGQFLLLARYHGVLAGRVNSDRTACFYFDGGSDQLAIIWPDDVTARANPLRISDSHGHRASVGDHVTFGGGLAADPPGSPVLGCGRPKAAAIVYFLTP